MIEPNKAHGFECPVCLESLSRPAGIEVAPPPAAARSQTGSSSGTAVPTPFTFGSQLSQSSTSIFGQASQQIGQATQQLSQAARQFGPASQQFRQAAQQFGQQFGQAAQQFGQQLEIAEPSLGHTVITFGPTRTPVPQTVNNIALTPAPARSDPTDICATACGHMFHCVCLDKWFRDNSLLSRNCPTCRQIVPQQVTRIFPTPLQTKPGGDKNDEEDQTLKVCVDSLANEHEKLSAKFKALEDKMIQLIGDKKRGLEEPDDEQPEKVPKQD